MEAPAGNGLPAGQQGVSKSSTKWWKFLAKAGSSSAKAGVTGGSSSKAVFGVSLNLSLEYASVAISQVGDVRLPFHLRALVPPPTFVAEPFWSPMPFGE